MRRGGVKSFVDDLVLGRGVVPSRAATSLRSVETQPLTRRFVRTRRATSPSLESLLAEFSPQVVCSAVTDTDNDHFFFIKKNIFFSLFPLSFLSESFLSVCLLSSSWRETGKPQPGRLGWCRHCRSNCWPTV